jgi:hypothetical protein
MGGIEWLALSAAMNRNTLTPLALHHEEGRCFFRISRPCSSSSTRRRSSRSSSRSSPVRPSRSPRSICASAPTAAATPSGHRDRGRARRACDRSGSKAPPPRGETPADTAFGTSASLAWPDSLSAGRIAQHSAVHENGGIPRRRARARSRADQPLGMHRLTPARRAITGDGVAGSLEAGVAADIHVQQVAGAVPLVAVGGLPGRTLWPGDVRPLEHFRDSRVSKAGDGSGQPWPPARLAAAGTDPLLQLGGEPARTPVRPARTIGEAGEARARLPTRPLPAVAPAVSGGGRDAEGRRGRLSWCEHAKAAVRAEAVVLLHARWDDAARASGRLRSSTRAPLSERDARLSVELEERLGAGVARPDRAGDVDASCHAYTRCERLRGHPGLL